MKKLLYALTIFFIVSAASAAVTDTGFEELPTAWETGEDLEFSMTSEGSDLDRVLFQSREPGEPGFTDLDTKICTNYGSCDWVFDHSEDDTGTFEYRFRVQSEGGGENTRYQQVTYYYNLDYGVEWIEEPPETASEGESVEMTVTADDSAGRFDEEGVLRLQYRESDGDWRTFDSRRCSNSDSDQTCSNHGSTSLNDRKLDEGTARFRGLIVFRGGVSAASSTKTTSIPGESGSVEDVWLHNLPSEAEDGTSFDITADAEGENLQRLYIQERDPDESGWTDWRSTDCDGGANCELTRSYSVDGTGDKEFRAYVEATGDSDASDLDYVDFVEAEDETPERDSVDSVNLDELPERLDVDEDFEVTGDASGTNLDEIELQTKTRFGSWSEVDSESCGNEDECDFQYDFDPESTGDLEFRLVARAGEDSEPSNIEVVEFYEEVERRVDDVDIDNLPSDHPTGEDLEITGDADGENLERIILQKRDPGDDWENVETQSCSGDTCDFEDDYSQSNEEEVDFRVKAEAGEDSETSGRETVDFEDDTIDSVEIDDLPSEHPTDEDLEISGEAEGEDLETLTIQEKDSDDDDWDDWRSEDCGGEDICEISRDFNEDDEVEKDFRIEAETDEHTDQSSVETVEFLDDNGKVENVEINSLPDEYSTETDLEISGSAEGEGLDTLTIQEKNSEDNDWNDYREKDCDNQDVCDISRDFSTNTEEEKDFRIKAEANGDPEYSGTETVEFIDEEGEVSSVNIINLPSSVEEGESFDIEAEASGENLQRIYIQQRDSGEDDWSDWRSEGCDGQNECYIQRTYSAASTGEKDFRAYAESIDESGSSTIETVDFTPRIRYRVQNVVLDEIPDRWNIADALEITGEAEGDNLNRLTLQTKKRFGSWKQQSSKNCDSSTTCSFETTFDTDNTENLEFKLVGYAGEESEESNIEVVNFFRTEDFRVDSVNIINLPNSYPVDETLQIVGDAQGENLETIQIQKRVAEEWQDVETESCSGDSCQINDYYIHGEEGTVDFRVRAEAAETGMVSGTETVDFYEEDNEQPPEPGDRITDVSIGNLPADRPVGKPLDILGEASGNNIDNITIQEREQDGEWRRINSEDCGEASTCSISESYTATETGKKDFRIKAQAGAETKYSETEDVDFYIKTTISSVNIDELGTSQRLSNPLTVSGAMRGQNLGDIEIQAKRRFTSWDTIESRECTGSPCDITTQYTTDETGDVEFRIKGTAGDKTKFSGIEVIEFRKTDIDDLVESIEVSSPEEALVDQEIVVDAELEGDVESLQIERSSGGSWKEIESRECGSGSCDLETVYKTGEPGTETFRAKAYSEDQSLTSDTTETVFYPEDGISEVTIENLPDQYPLDEKLEIEGSALGLNLEEIFIQSRKNQNWEDEKNVECTEVECYIETDFISNDKAEYDFRVKAVSDSGQAESSVETVEFIETASSGEPEISSVVLDGLQDEYPVRKEIEVSASATGKNLDTLKLQEKRRFESWNTFEQENCFGSSCDIDEDYESERTGQTEFRAIAEAGDDSEESNIEVVDFRAVPRQGKQGDNAQLEINVRDKDGRNLEDARVRVENGDTKTRYTDRYGETEFELEPDGYEVTASKTGYRTEDRDVELDEDEDETLRFSLDRLEDFRTSISYQDEVCRGEDLEVELSVENLYDSRKSFQVSGEGLGYETGEREASIGSGDEETVELVFRDVEGDGTEDFTVTVENDRTRNFERTVDVEDCVERTERDRNVPSGLSASINPREVVAGETVRITGDVQGVRSPVDVTVSTSGFSRTVSSTRSGGYSVFYTPESSGTKDFTISAGGVSTERKLDVLSRARVSRLEAPGKVVEGEQFEVCAEVSSDTEPEVILFRDGERLDSRSGSGNVCFDRTAGSSGVKNFWVRAAASGETGSASKKVEVIDQGEEVDSFPDQVQVRKTEPAQARLTLYNTEKDVAEYDIEIEGIEESWVSVTDRNVVLPQGDEKNVYIYFSPEEDGEFSPEIEVSRAQQTFSRQLSISSTSSRDTKGFFQRLF